MTRRKTATTSRRRKTSTRKRRSTTKKQRGRGTLGDIANFIRDNKLISKGLGMIPHPAGQFASQLAGMAGLGRRRKKATTGKRRTMRGRGIFSDLGGGIGNVFGGLGGGLGSVAHGLFGSGRKKGTSGKRGFVLH